MKNIQNQPLKAAKSTQQRQYLIDKEVNTLISTCGGRYADRDQAMLMLAYRHGFRSIELVNLSWNQINLDRGTIEVRRVKHGDESLQPLSGDEIRVLRKLRRSYPDSSFVFCTERSGPMTTRTFRNIVQQAGIKAGFDFPVHTHLLRHACGYQLVNKGTNLRAIQQYLGHRNIASTVRYTKLDQKEIQRV